jgi:hypothetical protein
MLQLFGEIGKKRFMFKAVKACNSAHRRYCTLLTAV